MEEAGRKVMTGHTIVAQWPIDVEEEEEGRNRRAIG
jgi:hypothetical protein